MFVNEKVLERGKDPNALFLFLHSQRTGGSNLQRWFQTIFSDDEIYSNRTSDDYVPWQKLTDLSVLNGRKLVAGFAQYRELPLDRPLVGLSNVRHPFYRIVSVYKMSRSHKTHFLRDISTTSSFEDFYLKGRDIRPDYFHNMMCRRIGGEPSADAAIESILKNFGLIATTNHLHEGTKALIAALDWKNVDPIPPNGAPPDEVNYASYASSSVRDEIIKHNMEDMRLFEFVNDKGVSPAKYASISETSVSQREVPIRPATAGSRLDAAIELARMDLSVSGDAERSEDTAEQKARAAEKHERAEAIGETDASDSKYNALADPFSTDVGYKAFLAEHPNTSFSEYYTTVVASKVRKGHQHNSLGTNIVTGEISDFWETGARQAKRMMAQGDVKPTDRVVEYGCGSLRLAGHLIKFLDRGNFMGLDIIKDFFEIGKEHIGRALLDEKKPQFAAISRESVAKAKAFDADYVFSHAVLIHVHPDDITDYFDNLSSIASRPGAVLAFNCMLYDEPIRYNNLGWAWPESFILKNLPGFEVVKITRAKRTIEKGGYQVHPTMFVLRRKQTSTHRTKEDRQAHESTASKVVAGPASSPVVAVHAAPSINLGGSTDSYEQSFRFQVDPAFGFRGVSLRLSIPSVPKEAKNASFAEHKAGTPNVVGVLKGGAIVSEDLGRNWEFISPSGASNISFVHCFTTSQGHRLLQVKAPADASYRDKDIGGAVIRYDKNWRKITQFSGSRHHWHGSRAVDEANGTIMFAEYPNNKQKYKPESVDMAVNSAVFRSRDGGSKWEKVFELSWQEIRHFHTLVADPYVPRQWWLSSGDMTNESRVWISKDDGDSWTDITDPAPDINLHPNMKLRLHSVHRYTDIWMDENELIWGADDWLGGPDAVKDDVPIKAGARMFRSPRSEPLKPRDAGWIGNPVRSITDLGPALLITTEAKRNILSQPQIYLMAKNETRLLKELCSFEVSQGAATGLTFSRASQRATNGVMFSYRTLHDLVTHPTRMLRWKFDFS